MEAGGTAPRLSTAAYSERCSCRPSYDVMAHLVSYDVEFSLHLQRSSSAGRELPAGGETERGRGWRLSAPRLLTWGLPLLPPAVANSDVWMRTN